MREIEIERHLKKEVEKRGAIILKFTSPGKAGVPDRIVLIKGGECIFVECKAPGKQLRKLQELIKRDLQKQGFAVWVIDSYEKIEEFCAYYFGCDKDGKSVRS